MSTKQHLQNMMDSLPNEHTRERVEYFMLLLGDFYRASKALEHWDAAIEDDKKYTFSRKDDYMYRSALAYCDRNSAMESLLVTFLRVAGTEPDRQLIKNYIKSLED